MAAVGPAIAALGITQIVGWGTTHYMPAILAAPTAADLGLSPTAVMGGFSWGILVAGLTARITGRLIDRHGARKVMSAASVTTSAGLLVLAAAQGMAGLLIGWTLLGLALRSILYDGAFAALTVLAGAGARRAISLLTLFGGLASTVFWPIGHWLDAGFGWRATLVVYAALNLAICLPLHWRFAGGPAAQKPPGDATAETAAHPGIGLSGGHRRIALWLLAATFTLHAFVNSTMAAHLVMLLDGLGLGATAVVSAAALMGVAQVAARLVEMLLQGRFSALATALPSVALLPAGFVVALAWSGSTAAAALFVILYGCANGLMTIVRGALPLALFGSRGYGELLGAVAGPALAVAALAPMAFSALVQATDARTGLMLLAAVSGGAFAATAVLALAAPRWTAVRPRTTPRSRRSP
ncbi:MAG: MFS transporter [Burkholderiales bacterium]|nr:MAG: MFS transporter [Burkholderiales bacterium]